MVLNIRQPQSRGLPTRGVKTKGSINQQLNQTTSVERGKSDTFKTNLKTTTFNVIGSVTNLNNLTQKAQSFFNDNLSKIPSGLQSTFKQYINDASRELRESQNNLRSKLIKSIAYYNKQEKYFSFTANKPSVADKYDTQARVASGLLSSLNSGNVLNDGATYQTIYSKGRLTQKEKEFRISQTEAKAKSKIESTAQTKKLSTNITTYIKSTSENNIVSTLKELKNKFSIDNATALEIRKIQQQNIRNKDFAGFITPSTQYLVSEINKDLNFYDRVTKTNASFPKNIQNARSIFLGEMNAKQNKVFLSLSLTNQKTMLSYSVLKSLNFILPKQTKQKEPKDIQKILKARGVNISLSDSKLLFEIGIAKNSDLLKMARVKDINKYIEAYNNSLKLSRELPLARSESLMLKIQKEFNDIVKSTKQKTLKQYLVSVLVQPLLKNTSITELMNNIAIDPIRKILTPGQLLNKVLLKLQWIKTRSDIQGGAGMTQKEYTALSNGLKDLTGFKTAIKKASTGTKQNFKKFIDTVIIDLSGKRKRTVTSYPKDIQKIRSLFYNELTPIEQKKFDKKAFVLVTNSLSTIKKISIRAFDIAINDWKTLGISILKFSPKIVKFAYKDGIKLGERFALYLSGERRTKEGKKDVLEITKILRLVAKGVNWVKENPGLVTLGIATGVLTLNASQKKLLKDNPKEWIAQAGSFFADDLAIQGLGKLTKLGKLAKIKLSPFVLRNIDVFSEGASLHVTAQTLSSLEGKSINLFSATPEGLFDIFKKSSSITKKEASVLIKDMLKNPMNYIGANFKIKNLNTIINSKPKSEILNFMKKNLEGILTGSGGLSLQLGKWRKVGDLDILVRNPKKYAYALLDHLNNKNLLTRIFNKPRFKVKKIPNNEVYRIYDSGFTGRFKYNANRVIVDIDGIAGYEQQFLKSGKLSAKDVRKIGGVNVLKVESVLPRKTELSLQSTKARRYEKELNDLRLITSKLNKKIKNKEFEAVKRLLDNEKGLLKVRGFADNLSMKRKWGWAEKLLGDLKLRFVGIYDPNPISRKWARKKNNEVIQRLKKVGLSDSDINKAINELAPNDMYFSPNTLYSYYLTNNGKLKKSAGVIIAKDIKISFYPNNLQKQIKDHLLGLLSQKQSSSLTNDLRKWRVKNPDKFFIGQQAIKDRTGELEVLLSEYSKLYAKKYFITREVYIPALDKFVKVQEVMLKKPTKKTIKMLYTSLQNKFKKGYSVSNMKDDISKWIKKNLDLLKNNNKKTEEIKKTQDIFLNNQVSKVNNKIDDVKKLNIPNLEKRELLKTLNREKRFLTPRNLNRYNKKFLISRVSRVISRISKSLKIIKRIPKRIIKKDIRQTTRSRKPIKRKTTTTAIRKRAITPRKPIKRAGIRTPKRIITPLRTPIRVPIRSRTPIRKIVTPFKPIDPIKKRPKLPNLPKFKLDWDTKPPRGYERIVNVLIRVKGINRELKWLTTTNRAMKRITRLVDNTTARSFKLKIIGLGKTKDINKFNLSKFRAKKSKGSSVLDVVERAKYSIDTRGEKRGLSISKALKKQKSMVTKKKMVVKRGIVKRNTNKRNVKTKTKKKTSKKKTTKKKVRRK